VTSNLARGELWQVRRIQVGLGAVSLPMARYVATLQSPWTSAEAFTFLSDLRNLTRWDPGVLSVAQVKGSGGEPGASFDVKVKSIGRGLVLRYVTTAFDEPGEVVVEARSRFLTSIDRITITPNDSACRVTYDAELRLNGGFRVADPLLGAMFKRIGDRAVSGLRRVFSEGTSPE
jgi:carbon monoxide dehydrogenase subunit G